MPTNMTILKSPDMQRWRRKSHWSDLHLLKVNPSTSIK